MPDQVPAEVVGERFQRLVALQERIALERNRALMAPRSSCWSSGPAPRGTPPACPAAPAPTSSATSPRPGWRPGSPDPMGPPRRPGWRPGSPGRGGAPASIAPGDLVTVRVEHAAPHHLLAGPVLSHCPRTAPDSSCAVAPPPRPLPAGAVPLPLVG